MIKNNKNLHLLSNSKLSLLMFHLCLLLLQLCWSFCISCNRCISKHLLHCLVIYNANRLCTAYDTLLVTIPAQYWGTATVQRQRTVHNIGGQEAWAQVLDVKQRVTHPLTGLCRQNPGFKKKFHAKFCILVRLWSEYVLLVGYVDKASTVTIIVEHHLMISHKQHWGSQI